MISEFWGLCHNCVLTKAREQWERPCHSILAFLVPLGFQPSWTQNQTTHTSRSLSNCRPGARTATSARPQRQEPRGTNRAGTTTVSANGTRKRTGHVERHGGEGLMPSSKRTWWDNHRAFSLYRVWSKLSPPTGNEEMNRSYRLKVGSCTRMNQWQKAFTVVSRVNGTRAHKFGGLYTHL